MATPISSTQLLGARLLTEIGNEEGSLEDVRLFPPNTELLSTTFFLIDKLLQIAPFPHFSSSSFH
jgi:hypothetical protein